MIVSALLAALMTCAATNEPYRDWDVQTAAADQWPESVAVKLSGDELADLAASDPPLPYRNGTVGLRTADGAVWVGAPRGLMQLAAGAPRWRLFHSRRWLPNNQVIDLAAGPDQSVWVRTSDGVVRFFLATTTLEAKLEAIHAELRRRHLRLGLVGEIDLVGPEESPPRWEQPSSDNDGLWTSLYVAAESFRYGATGAPDAKQNAWESLRALMLLEHVTGIPGFAARSIVPGDEPDPTERYGGEWHRSQDGKWWWKGDTSSDELDGHYFAYPIYFDLCATADEKQMIALFVQRITDHLITRGYYYVGPSGKPTRWGVFAPERLNHDLNWIAERGLNSLEMLSHLKVADHVLGSQPYREASRRLIDDHAYAINTVEQKILWPTAEVNHSDDELAFLAYYPLLWYERDPELRRIYLASLRRSWLIERPERSPLFNFIYAAGLQASQWTTPNQRPDQPLVPPADYDRDQCVEWFRLVPSDMTHWRIENSHRQDLGDLMKNRFDRPRTVDTVLPVDERRLMRWNGDPYELDGGSGGRSRDDGTFVLLPYWLGRYHRFLD